jgi:hypothetical protein
VLERRRGLVAQGFPVRSGCIFYDAARGAGSIEQPMLKPISCLQLRSLGSTRIPKFEVLERRRGLVAQGFPVRSGCIFYDAARGAGSIERPMLQPIRCLQLRSLGLTQKREWKGMKMASCLVPQGFPVRSGCIEKVMPPERRGALWSQ